MSLWISLLPELLIGAFVLSSGILIGCDRSPGMQKPVIESLVWSGGFVVSFSLEILLIGSN